MRHRRGLGRDAEQLPDAVSFLLDVQARLPQEVAPDAAAFATAAAAAGGDAGAGVPLPPGPQEPLLFLLYGIIP